MEEDRPPTDALLRMLDQSDQVFLSIQRDYMPIVGQVSVNVTMSREERTIRRELDQSLAILDGRFKELLGRDLGELKAEQAEHDVVDEDVPNDQDESTEEEDGQSADENVASDAEEGAGDEMEFGDVEESASAETASEVE